MSVKHVLEYEKCHSGDDFESLPSNEAKDLYYVYCQNKWIAKMKNEAIPGIYEKARQLFGKND